RATKKQDPKISASELNHWFTRPRLPRLPPQTMPHIRYRSGTLVPIVAREGRGRTNLPRSRRSLALGTARNVAREGWLWELHLKPVNVVEENKACESAEFVSDAVGHHGGPVRIWKRGWIQPSESG